MDAPCVLKVGVGELERVWMPAVAHRSDDVVADVVDGGILPGSGESWLLLEDLPFRARSDRPDDIVEVMRCAARFQEVAAGLELPTYRIDADFVRSYAEQAIGAGCPGPAAEILAHIDDDDRWVRSLGPVVGHGDVHFWNAVAATPDGPWRLIDPIPRAAHWAWDAAYAQLTSGVPETPDLIAVLAEQRARRGMAVEEGERLSRVRTILLGWSSLLWWAILPSRRGEEWWRGRVGAHVSALVDLER